MKSPGFYCILSILGHLSTLAALLCVLYVNLEGVWPPLGVGGLLVFSIFTSDIYTRKSSEFWRGETEYWIEENAKLNKKLDQEYEIES